MLIRQVAAVTEMDQSLVNRIENGERLPTKEQLYKLAGLYGLDLKETYSTWLAERMIRDYGNEPLAHEAYREAHDKILKHNVNSNFEKFSDLFTDSETSPANQYKNTPSKRGRKPNIPGNDNSNLKQFNFILFQLSTNHKIYIP